MTSEQVKLAVAAKFLEALAKKDGSLLPPVTR